MAGNIYITVDKTRSKDEIEAAIKENEEWLEQFRIKKDGDEMTECKECGTLLESEPYYEFKLRVKDIPQILKDEAEERYEAKKAAGEYAGYYGSRGRLIRIELEKVILSRLRFWYTEEEVAERTDQSGAGR